MEQHLLQELRSYLAALQHRRSLPLTSLTVCLLAALIYNYATRPLYQATVQILIQRNTPHVLPSKDLLVDDRRQGLEYVTTQYHLLRGRALAERVVERLNLHKSPEYTAGPPLAPWTRVRRLLWGTTEDEAREPPMSPAVAALRARLTVDPVPQSNLVNLRLTGYDPVLAALTVNTVAEAYIEQAQELTYTTRSEASGWLGDRLAEQQEKLEEAERTLQAYRERENLVNIEDRRGLVEQKLTALTASVMNVRSERIAQETLYRQMRGTPPDKLLSFPAMMANPTLQALKAQQAGLQRDLARLSETMGEKHPDMIRVRTELRAVDEKMAAEMQNVVRSVESAYKTAQEQEQNLIASLDGIKDEALAINRKAIDFGVLRREVESQQQLYQALLTRAKETGLETELKATNIQIVEKAEIPGTPLYPRRMWNYQLALAVGLTLGLLLVVAAEQLDNTLKTPEELKNHVGLPFLGMVADATSRKFAGAAVQSPLTLKNPRSPLAEAYRVVRTNLLFSSTEPGCRALLVTSVNPGEGKSTTVVNLAASLAQNGSRVLVVDGDLRRPTANQHFGLAPTPGLSDVLVGRATTVEAVRSTPVKNLDLLPCGYVPPNPAELLGSVAMKEVIDTLRPRYDWILVDSPPVLGMADAPVLCRAIDAVVVVVGAERTTRQSVHRAIEQLGAVGAKLLGVVLNRVDLERNSYYFGQYYSEYYRSQSADPAPRAVRGRDARPGDRP